jgi:hypothetical protein
LSPLERRIFRPAKLVGPDEESAIKQAIEEFKILLSYRNGCSHRGGHKPRAAASRRPNRLPNGDGQHRLQS